MNFDVGEAEKQVCERIKRIFAEDAAAEITQMETLSEEDLGRVTRQGFALLSKAGYPMSSGKDGRNSVSLVIIQEQLAALAPDLFLSLEMSIRILGRFVAVYGADDQKRAMLPGLEKGEDVGAVALSEKSMNIENEPLQTKGVPSADGCRVTGSKGHVVNGPIADWVAVAGTIEGQEGPVFFLIEKGSEGLSIDPRLATVGYGGAAISPVILEDCTVPLAHVIQPGDGAATLETVRMWEDQVLTAASLGLMRRSFDGALHYAKTHSSGGKPIIAYQEVGFKLAEMLTLYQTAQLLAYRAAWMSESGDREAGVMAHSAKVFCAESAEKIASEAFQILGQRGYVCGNPVEAGYRDAKYIQIAGTSTEISRMKIGDRVLGY